MANKELAAIAKKAAEIKAGIGVPEVKASKRKGADVATPAKRNRGADEDVESPSDGKRTGIDAISMTYILWGHSQKPKIAGVCSLACSFFTNDQCGISLDAYYSCSSTQGR